MAQGQGEWGKGFDLLETSPDCVAILSEDCVILCLNPAFCGVLEVPQDQVSGAFLSFVEPDDRPATTRILNRVRIDRKAARFTNQIGQRKRLVEWSASPFGEHQLLLVGRDVTEEKQKQEELYQLAHFDTVTALPNRHLFLDRGSQGLAAARRENRQAAVVFLDLDDFKPANDNHGHAVGDEVLREVANRLRDGSRDTDTVTRLGGDEFAVFLSMLKRDIKVKRLVTRLLQRLNRPFKTSRGEITVTASYGFAVFPEDGSDLDTLLCVADDRMYEHKRSKRK